MFFISHRGNINGKDINKENKPLYINQALKKGYHVEVDVWLKNGLYLGHDKPQYKINKKFLLNKKLWCHAKNLEALVYLKKIKAIFYWHQKDDFTMTSNGYIWTYPGKKLSNKSIRVLPEYKKSKIIKNISGICSDYIKKYKSMFIND